MVRLLMITIMIDGVKDHDHGGGVAMEVVSGRWKRQGGSVDVRRWRQRDDDDGRSNRGGISTFCGARGISTCRTLSRASNNLQRSDRDDLNFTSFHNRQ